MPAIAFALNRILVRSPSHGLTRSHCERRFSKRHCLMSGAVRRPEVDLAYLTDPLNEAEIQNNIDGRKGVGCIRTVNRLHREFLRESDPAARGALEERLLAEALKIPNRSHPSVRGCGADPAVVETGGAKPDFGFPPLQFHELAGAAGGLRTENLGNLTGHRSYYFVDALALLEQALVQYTVDRLTREGFLLYSVPDLLRRDLIEGCGMDTRGERAQVYHLDRRHAEDVCLSGTAEMALGSYFADRTIPVDTLPLKVAAVSRCYRAETSNVQEEKGIYRVHQFTKVEMFGIARGEAAASDELLDVFVGLQRRLFDGLGLHYQVLDMPAHELGAPAYRKFDVEAWMAGRGLYGEISSASNCTDYQARRLGIRTSRAEAAGGGGGGGGRAATAPAHTVNGTACAVPRMLIALFEANQLADGQVVVPAVLRPYCRGMERVVPAPSPPIKLHWIKSKSQQHRL